MALLAARFAILILAMLVAQVDRRKKTNRGKSKRLYNRSEKNVIIDSVVHPLAEQHWSFVIIDGALHALNEQDPIQSFVKFLRYNAPELLKRILKEMH
jgi:hypothetical protein